MNLFGAEPGSPDDQLRRLREQAGFLIKGGVEPVASSAAATVATAQPIRRLLDVLSLVAEYGGLASRVFRRMRGQAEKGRAGTLPHGAARHWSAPLRPLTVAVLVLGVGYVAYRLSVSQRPAAG